MQNFDYIIIGAGAAGCVLANRLSANPDNSVCLIEAGGSDRSPWVKIPAGVFGLYGNKKYDYAYTGLAQQQLNGRQITVNRGKCLGGSSSINGMVYIRGNPNDYDNWEKQGCKGWSYAELLPLFKSLERNLIDQEPEFHGFDGELSIVEPQDPNPLSQIFVGAGAEAGLPQNNDFNAESQFGLGIYNLCQYKGVRVSSFSAFVDPIRHRSNLTILKNTEVVSLQIEEKQVTGVFIQRQGQADRLDCSREVLLSAGAIDSPRILLASGIGDRQELEQLGIVCRQHLPGVGKNLQDHVDCMVTVRSRQAISIGLSLAALPDIIASPLRYLFKRLGWWTTNYTEAGGFARTVFAEAAAAGSRDADPDIQFHFTPIFRSHRGKKFEFGHGYSLFTCVLRPHSRGSVKLANDGSHRNVIIDHQLLADERDQKLLIEALKKARQVLASAVFDKFRGEEMAPGPDVQSDEDILAYLRNSALTVYHPVGTCKMGVDEMAVLDPDSLRVKGLNNLRVADASIMPDVISGNTSAASMMIGAKAAQLIG